MFLPMAAATSRLDKTAQAELGRAIVLDLIESAMAERVDAGAGAWTATEQTSLAQAVFDSLFRLGRLRAAIHAVRAVCIRPSNRMVDLSLGRGDVADVPGRA